MLTWALVYLITIVKVLPGGVFLLIISMASDVTICYFILCAIKGVIYGWLQSKGQSHE